MVIHSTYNEKLLLAGGDLFSQECIERHDGMLAFIHKGFNALWNNKQKALEEGKLNIPTHFIDYTPETCDQVAEATMKGLSILAEQGCRKIVVHGGKVRQGSYKEGAEACVKGVESWLMSNYDKVDYITLIDRKDDYYKIFGSELEKTK